MKVLWFSVFLDADSESPHCYGLILSRQMRIHRLNHRISSQKKIFSINELSRIGKANTCMLDRNQSAAAGPRVRAAIAHVLQKRPDQANYVLEAGCHAITVMGGICAKRLPKRFSPHRLIFFRPGHFFFVDRSGKFDARPSLPTRNKNKTRTAAGALCLRRQHCRAGPFNVRSSNAYVGPTAETAIQCPKTGRALGEILHQTSLVPMMQKKFSYRL